MKIIEDLRLSGDMPPYSDAAQTSVIVTYAGVPDGFIGEILPSVGLSVLDFLKFKLPELCVVNREKKAGATLRWSDHEASSALDVNHVLSFKLPPPDDLNRFIISSVPKTPNLSTSIVFGSQSRLQLYGRLG